MAAVPSEAYPTAATAAEAGATNTTAEVTPVAQPAGPAPEPATRAEVFHAAASIDAAVAREKVALAAAFQGKRTALMSAADAQAGAILAGALAEHATTLGALQQREQASRLTFTVARNNVRITQAAQAALARNDAAASVKRLRDGVLNIGTQVREAAATQGTRMKTAARTSVGNIQGSCTQLNASIDGAKVNVRGLVPDIESDEEQDVNTAIRDAKDQAKGAVNKTWLDAFFKLNGNASENASTFDGAAGEIIMRLEAKLPDAVQGISDGGEAVAGLIDSMARSQLRGIDTAEQQTIAAIGQARVQASNILTASRIAVAQLRTGVAAKIMALNAQEVAATGALDRAGADAGAQLGRHKRMTASRAHTVVHHAKAALAKGTRAQLAELDGTSATAIEQVNGASNGFSAAVGGQRDHLLGAIDAAIGDASAAMATSLTDMAQQMAGYRAAAIATYAAAETQIIAGAQPEIAKAQGEWRGKADEFVASCTAYETEAIEKHGEVKTGLPSQLEEVVHKTIEHARRSTARKIWDGIKSGLGAIAHGLVVFVVAVVVVAVIIVAVIGAEFIGLAVGIALAVVGVIMLAIGFVQSLYQRFKQLWNNDWPWYAKILGIPAAIGVAVGDTLGLSQIAEAIRGKELISDRELSTEERARRATEGAFQLITLGLIREYTRGGSGEGAPPVGEGAPPGAKPIPVGEAPPVGEGAPPVPKSPAPRGEAGEPAKTGQQGEPSVEGPQRRGQCFVPGTPVHTPRGMLPIERIAVGDDVFGAALDTPGAQATVARVTQVFARHVPEVLDLDFGDEIVTCSPEHPFHVAGGGWRTAGALVPGTAVTSREGPAITLIAVAQRTGNFAVHNIEVAVVHDYFVGRLGLLVHNKPMMSYDFHAEQLARRANALPAKTPGRAKLIAEADALAKEAKESPGEDIGDKIHDLDTRISIAEIPTASEALAARAASLAERASKLPMKSANRWALIDAASKLQGDAKALSELSRDAPPDRAMLDELDQLQRRWAELEHDVTAEEPAPAAPKTVWEQRLEDAKWDDHGHKHTQATTDAEAKQFSTPSAEDIDPPSQYLPEVDVPALEREALDNGTVYKGDPNTPGSTVFLRYQVPGDKIIGYDGGEPVSTMRVEITAGDFFHGHPRDFTKGK